MLMKTDHGLGMLDTRMGMDGMDRGDIAVLRDQGTQGVSVLSSRVSGSMIAVWQYSSLGLLTKCTFPYTTDVRKTCRKCQYACRLCTLPKAWKTLGNEAYVHIYKLAKGKPWSHM